MEYTTPKGVRVVTVIRTENAPATPTETLIQRIKRLLNIKKGGR